MRHSERSLATFLLVGVLLFPSSTEARPPTGNGGNYDLQPKYYAARPYWSGTLSRQTAVTTVWFMYPGACVQRALGTWAAKSSPVADSLQPTAGFPNSSGYTDDQPDIAGGSNTIAYTRGDGSLNDKLWHVVDAATAAGERPAIIDGSRSLWCGKYEPWVHKVGYPNRTFQVLYLDTGVHAASYTLEFEGNISAEQNYDYFTILGGGSSGQLDHSDPLQNRRDLMSALLPQAGAVTGGPHGDSDQIVSWTGSIQTPQTVVQNHSPDLFVFAGAASGQPNTVSYSVTIDADHRALYLVFTSDSRFSSNDGLWPSGTGPVIDLVSMTESATTTSLYNDQVAAGGVDPFSGSIVTGTYGSAGFISSRVPAGVGELWQLAPGTENVTSDLCAPQKAFSSDLFFEGGDPNTNLAVNKQFNSIVSCTFAVPVGTASIFAQWNAYFDLPLYSGYVQYVEYRIYKGGGWSDWRNTAASNVVRQGSNQAWDVDGHELAEATQADSFQVRWNIECIPPFAADQSNCSTTQTNALLYDDFRIQVTSGVPAPIFGIFPGAIAQSTFVDGTMDGTNCTVNPCWPGNRGSDLDPMGGTLHNIAVNDNWNAPLGDSISLAIVTGLRKNGMGVNWHHGTDLTIDAGENGLARTNAAFVPAFDKPRMIYRLFDPATKAWSAFDSTEIFANVSLSGPDTLVLDSEYAVNWPPQDKLAASLPPGFTINGISAYAGLKFLPRGTRMQYYFKAVDINGGRSYQFSSDNLAREVEDLPTLPGSALRAPDIIEFRVLPSIYPAGPAGSLLAGRTDTPLLNLDGTYTNWSFGYDPVTQALRGLGVRADRYRSLQGYELASNIGGHELPGRRIGHFSNYFPNYLEYPIADSLAAWYRIMIQSGHNRTVTVLNESDATLVEQWWGRDTGSNGGDRCLFISGDDVFNTMLNTTGVNISLQTSLSQNVFGVASVTNAWSGTTGNAFPTIDDRFAAASAGPALAAAMTFTYPVDGGCPGSNKFDALVKVGDSDAAAHAFYPNSQIAGIARARELDTIGDKDRNKALAYGYSIQLIRDPAYGIGNANYTRSGVENRMRVLYKFLTGCRGARTAAAADTGKCWPCPSPGTTLALMQTDWAGQSAGFVTGTWGPLYPIQAGALATAVEDPAPESPPHVNTLLQNRPNPFNPETVIPYSIATRGRVMIQVFDVMGRRVKALVDRTQPAGIYTTRWNGKNDGGLRAASGVYFYRITYPNGEVSARKLMIVR